MPELRVRAGVLTGNAAVDIGAEREGMVLGDAVNTASRLQSLAAPGTVLVDDVSRRASEAAIAYEDGGTHEVKGREQPVHAWRALRVVAGVGGARRSAGLEAPFIGRERELERVIAASEETETTGRSRLIAVVGEAGSGKSRLLWEFDKHMDGVEKVVLWHTARCLAYGEGVGYWALAEMVRARAGIVEEEDADDSRAKLRVAIETYVADERERRLIEPRLAHLLGLEHRSGSDRADLFSGWRLFFERLSERAPVILAFEDLQWADSGLLDFIDYLLEWSAQRPIFVLALGRPELAERRPEWETIRLERLPDAAMRDALEGLVPGLPSELTGRILRQAEGIPLYAVETVRMLLDRGLLAQQGARYVPTADVGELDVPETLHALAAARLDGLSAPERAVLQDASVFGQSFTVAGVAALGSRGVDEVRRTLDGLVAKQILALNDDALSAERGQYHFLQGLLRATAYGMLSRRDRKQRHLAVARHLQEAWGDSAPDLAEVLAAHLVDAAEADPDAADVGQIRRMACETLADAGRRALSLALGPEAQRAFDRAAELAEDDRTRAVLLEEAGGAAVMAATDTAGGQERLRRAIAIFEDLGDRGAAARALAGLAHALARDDLLEEAIELGRRAVAGLPDGSVERAAALAALSTHLGYLGAAEEAADAAGAALTVAEPLQEWPVIVRAFRTTAHMRLRQGRNEETAALLDRALRIALEHDLSREAVVLYNNQADIPLQADRYRESIEIAERGAELARSRGERQWQALLEMMIGTCNGALGRWDRLPTLDDVLAMARDELTLLGYLPIMARVYGARGDREALSRIEAIATTRAGSANVEFSSAPIVAHAMAARAQGRHAEALELALPVAFSAEHIPNEERREAVIEAGLAALAVDDEPTVERLIAHVTAMPPVLRAPLFRATSARFEGLLAARRGDPPAAGQQLSAAVRVLREIEARPHLGQVLLELAEALGAAHDLDGAQAALEEAQAIFRDLGARPWLERAGDLEARVHA